MRLVAIVLGLAIVALGAVGIASPPRLLGIVGLLQTRAGLYLAAVVRLVLGAALFLSAADSRAPEVLRVLGVVIVVAGLITPFFGLERYRRLLDWWSARGPTFVRVWAVFAAAFGLGLVYALLP